MRFKNYCALVLAGAMLAGTVGVMNPVTAMAEETSGATSANTYTLTVPKNFAISNSRWNDVGAVTVTKNGTLDDGKQVTVTATSANGFKLVNADASDSTDEKNQIGYTMKTAEDGEEATTFTFNAADINSESGASQDFGVYVDDFGEKAEGNYTDTLNFTAQMSGDSGNTGGDQEKADLNDLFKEGNRIEVGVKDNDEVITLTAVAGKENDGNYTYTLIDADQNKVDNDYKISTDAGGNKLKFSADMLNSDNSYTKVSFYIGSDGEVRDEGKNLQYIKINGKLFYEAESGDDSGNTGGDTDVEADSEGIFVKGSTIDVDATLDEIGEVSYSLEYDQIMDYDTGSEIVKYVFYKCTQHSGNMGEFTSEPYAMLQKGDDGKYKCTGIKLNIPMTSEGFYTEFWIDWTQKKVHFGSDTLNSIKINGEEWRDKLN